MCVSEREGGEARKRKEGADPATPKPGRGLFARGEKVTPGITPVGGDKEGKYLNSGVGREAAHRIPRERDQAPGGMGEDWGSPERKKKKKLRTDTQPNTPPKKKDGNSTKLHKGTIHREKGKKTVAMKRAPEEFQQIQQNCGRGLSMENKPAMLQKKIDIGGRRALMQAQREPVYAAK